MTQNIVEVLKQKISQDPEFSDQQKSNLLELLPFWPEKDLPKLLEAFQIPAKPGKPKGRDVTIFIDPKANFDETVSEEGSDLQGFNHALWSDMVEGQPETAEETPEREINVAAKSIASDEQEHLFLDDLLQRNITRVQAGLEVKPEEAKSIIDSLRARVKP